MKAFMLFLVLAIIFGSLGCSAPQLKRGRLVNEFNIQKKISPEERRIAVCVEEFTTAKSISDPHVIGDARVGVFNVHSEIRSEDPTQLVLANELKRAFLLAGFKIGEKGKSDIIVSGQIERFWVDENIGGITENAKASVRYDIIVKDKEGRFVWGKSIERRKVSGKSIDATKDNIPTLMDALRKSIESIFEDESFWNAIKR